MSSQSSGRKTPFYDCHLDKGAKIVNFNGWALPVQYSGIIEEVNETRNNAALFDVSHMGEIKVEGKDASKFLQWLLTNDISRLTPGRIQYSMLCNENGGVIDDLLLYKLDEEKYWLVVNAVNKSKVLSWLLDKKGSAGSVDITDESHITAQLALQGPRSVEIIKSCLENNQEGIDSLNYFEFLTVKLGGDNVLISKTGYTGEDGVEIYLSPEKAFEIWELLERNGRAYEMAYAGLGARDVLRLEAGLPLYGNEMSEEISPLEAGLNPFVKFNSDFIGKEVLEEQKQKGLKKQLVGFEVEGRRPPRKDYEIIYQGRGTGFVSSGSYSPTLKKSFGMGFVPPGIASPGTGIVIKLRKKKVSAEIVRLPFYRRG